MRVKVVIAKFGTVEFEGDKADLGIFNDVLPDLLKTMRAKSRGSVKREEEAQK